MEKAKAVDENWGEKGSRWLRNINALGAVAFGGVGLLVGSEVLVGYGVFNTAQAVFFEMTRRFAKRKKVAGNMPKKIMPNLKFQPAHA